MMKASWCKGLAVAALAASGLASASGCAALASANAAHSRITGCVDEVGYSVFDLLLAAGSTGLLVGLGKVDESPAWMLVPGTFVTSGVVGSIFVHLCRKEKRGGGATLESSPAYQPVETRASDAPDATAEQLGAPAAGPSGAAGASGAPGVKLQLDPDYAERHPPSPPPPTTSEAAGAGAGSGAAGEAPKSPEELMKIPCGTDLPGSCPPKTSCLLFQHNRGYCVADPSAP